MRARARALGCIGVVSVHTVAHPHQPRRQVGFVPSQVVVATALSSGVASILCGVFGNLPFGLAPGTGLSVYLTYGLVMADVMTKEQGMAACLLSGVLLGVCTLVGVANVVMRVTPLSIKLATVVSVWYTYVRLADGFDSPSLSYLHTVRRFPKNKTNPGGHGPPHRANRDGLHQAGGGGPADGGGAR